MPYYDLDKKLIRAVIKDMIKVCKKHNIVISGYDEGYVNIRPADNEYSSSVSSFKFTPSSGSIDDVTIED